MVARGRRKRTYSVANATSSSSSSSARGIVDERFATALPVKVDYNNQLINYIKQKAPYFSRGSNGETIVPGATSILFDLDKEESHSLGPENAFEILVAIQKQAPPGPDGKAKAWETLKAGDESKFCLVPYWPAHMFKRLIVQVNHVECRQLTGTIDRGEAFNSGFMLAHLKDEYRLPYARDSNDPVNTAALSSSGWTFKGTTANDWSKYFDAHIKEKQGLKFYFRPNSFPFNLGRAIDTPRSFLPALDNTQITIGLSLDGSFSNCFIKSADSTDNYRIVIEKCVLHFPKVELTQAGARYVRHLQGKRLGMWPSCGTAVQRLFYLAGTETGDMWTFESCKKPWAVYICAVDEDAYAPTNKTPTAKDRTATLEHRISELEIRFEGRELWIGKPNPCVIGHEEMKNFRKVQFMTNNHFRQPLAKEYCAAPDVEKIEGFRYRGPIIPFSNGSNRINELISTITPDNKADPDFGKLTIKVTADQSLQKQYLVSLLYKDKGVYFDPQRQAFISSVFLPD